MRFDHTLVFIALLVTSLPKAVTSLYSEDAGVFDFTVATSGHGVTNIAIPYEDSVVTTDGITTTTSSTTTSCFVASRKINDGSLNWRRNVCSKNNENQQKHAMTVLDDTFFTTDNTGITRAWTMKDGNLIWDAQVVVPSPSSEEVDTSKLWTFSRSNKDYVAVSSNEELHILEATTGHHFDTVGTQKTLRPKSDEIPHWLAIVPDSNNNGGAGPIRGIFGFVNENGTVSGNRMFLVSFDQGDDQIKSSQPLNQIGSSIVASSLKFQIFGDVMYAVAVADESNSLVYFSVDKPSLGDGLTASSLNNQWSAIESIEPTTTPSSSSSLIAVQGSDAESNPSMSLYQFDGSGSSSTWSNVFNDADTGLLGAVTYCPATETIVAMTPTSPQLYRLSGTTPLKMTGDMLVPDGDVVSTFQVLGCSSGIITTLLSTVRGTTTVLAFQISGDSAETKILWTAEEGLASISSAILLDASHLGVDDLVEEQDVVMQKLSLPSRINSQWEGVASMLSGDMFENRRRDHTFGFKKVAATISQKSHRMWGVDTSGDDRGSVRWSLDLPREALWHSMVHGTTNSVSSLHGINGGTHSREILVLSQLQSITDWKCVDGTNGAVHDQGAVDSPSPVLQVIPIYGSSSGGCRQISLLLHEDLSLSLAPNDPATFKLVQQQIHAAPNGFFTHLVDKGTSTVQAFHITESSGKFVTTKIGRTLFSGEKVMKVAYPIRDEVVQSMCTILGDDSLLLKYINPHMAAVITVLSPSEESDEIPTATELASSIEKKEDKEQPRKPVGAGNDASTAAQSGGEQSNVPNMFVNLIDTVSGRVVHRASHYSVDPESNFAVVVSENWVVYSFLNAKTRRTELGVLTLHEGMIESKGLTMFTSPEQSLEFSSLDVRSSKPVVLDKTYTFPKMITALSTTATRGGISSRKILVASADGKLTSIDRAMLETRRPVGEVKEAEKKEGLFPYKELIPEVSMMALNYNQTVESIRSIVSTSSALESQSLVFAFGGPDLFFTRTSPSRGFDLLPDSFSKVLVSLVTIGLLIVLFVVMRMGSKKIVQQGWM